MEEVVIVSGARTAVGRFGGGFVNTSASDLGAAVIKAAVERAGLEPGLVQEVIMGCAGQVGEDAYLARHAEVKAGLPFETPAYTVNRLCASGLEAINTAARWIEVGDADIVVAGGAENMSMFPFIARGVRWGTRMGDTKLEDALTLALSDPFNKYHMGVTAENLSEQYEISREEQDELAVHSHQKAIAAIESGRFKEQIVSIEVRAGRETKVIDTDEHPRADATIEGMAKLKPAFKDGGCVTAGNSSGINDGAAAVVLMSRRKAGELGITPRMRMVGRAGAGVDPKIMGSGPIPAVRRVLERTGMGIDQIDVVELNEAFATVAVACAKMLGISDEALNPNGGAVALGHPVGATGAILTVKAMYEMERSGGQYGLVTLCIGGGQGLATIFERLN